MATWQVLANTDDCNRRLTTSYWNLGAEYVIAGYGTSATNKQWGCGMRFTNITIPKEASINEAHLTFRATADKSVATNSRISAEDVNNAVTFADDSAAFDTRWAARTTARVDWDDIAAWTSGTDYNSPDIKTVIQEIVNRAGWVSGNAIVIFWEDFEDRTAAVAQAHRQGGSYEDITTYAPKLVISYYGGAVEVTTQAMTDIVTTTATGNGNIVSLGTPSAIQHGHCWNTTGSPTIADSNTENGIPATTGAFTSNLTGLTIGTRYYVRAYATNAEGTAYGNQVIFTAGTTGSAGGIYPCDDVARVSSIRHIAQPGSLRMQLGLGDLGFDVDVAEATVRSALDTAKELQPIEPVIPQPTFPPTPPTLTPTPGSVPPPPPPEPPPAPLRDGAAEREARLYPWKGVTVPALEPTSAKVKGVWQPPTAAQIAAYEPPAWIKKEVLPGERTGPYMSAADRKAQIERLMKLTPGL